MLTTLIQLISTRQRMPLLRTLPTNSVGAEIGVFKGAFSARILKTLQPRKLHLIDPWHYETDTTYQRSWYGGRGGGGQAMQDAIHQSVRDRFAREIASGVMTVHRAMSADAATSFADDYFDWVYIDGNHLYEFVKADLNAFFPKVKPGGLLCGDDYGVKGWWDHGVTRAVDEFVASGTCKPIAFQRGQFVLRKPGS